MIRIEGPTPAGGSYAEVYYYDKFGNPTDDPTNAETSRGCEFDDHGNLIQETFFVKDNAKDNTEEENVNHHDKEEKIK